jgi:hypothetical protein
VRREGGGTEMGDKKREWQWKGHWVGGGMGNEGIVMSRRTGGGGGVGWGWDAQDLENVEYCIYTYSSSKRPNKRILRGKCQSATITE